MINKFSIIVLCILIHGFMLYSCTQQKPRIVVWSHLSSTSKEIPLPDVGRQTASLIFDIDKDGVNDFVIAGWGEVSMVWFRHVKDGWKRYLIDSTHKNIAAGGAICDIDKDGDIDILQGGGGRSNHVWWWENPYPNYEINVPWNCYTIKEWGQNQHHDQIFCDFDGDGKEELVLWNQQGKRLLIAEVQENPKVTKNWLFEQIWSWDIECQYEGLAKADIDMDGKIDIVGGGFWFKHDEGTKFIAHKVDRFGSSRSDVGDLINGGRPEIVLSSGDKVGPLNLYEWNGNIWIKRTLIDTVKHGHSLQVADINGDGNMDIFCAEMSSWGRGKGRNTSSKTWIFYGDGNGNLKKYELKEAEGIGNHESKLGDLDDDGDIDILQKPFELNIPRIDIWINEGTID